MKNDTTEKISEKALLSSSLSDEMSLLLLTEDFDDDIDLSDEHLATLQLPSQFTTHFIT